MEVGVMDLTRITFFVLTNILPQQYNANQQFDGVPCTSIGCAPAHNALHDLNSH
jgi:hypothetical protein